MQHHTELLNAIVYGRHLMSVSFFCENVTVNIDMSDTRPLSLILKKRSLWKIRKSCVSELHVITSF